MDNDLLAILSLLSFDKKRLSKLLQSSSDSMVYFDKDSEDLGQRLVEVALLRLTSDIFCPDDSRSEVLQSILYEMKWVISLALHYGEFGSVNLKLEEDSNEQLWEVLNRFAKLALRNENSSSLNVSLDDFYVLLKKYNYSYVNDPL